MTLLTLAMIVRDEAARLPAFLAHHRDLVDEMVVVDTGSLDSTVALAREAGAQVVEEPWRDDFAAARNAGLAVARSEAILLLDADERIATKDFDRLRAAAAQPRTAWLMETRNYLPTAGHLEWQPPSGHYPDMEEATAGYFAARRISLFRRHESLCFSGRLHETVLPAVRQLGWGLEPLAVPIHHFGHLDAGAAEKRRGRDRRLAALKLADHPHEPAALLEWASVLLEDGDREEARTVLVQAAQGPSNERAVNRAQVLLAHLKRQEGDEKAAEELLSAVVRQDPDLLFGWLELIRCRAAQDSWNDVLALVDAALERFGADQALLLRERLRGRARTGRLAGATRDAAVLAERYPQWTEIVALHRRLAKVAGDS